MITLPPEIRVLLVFLLTAGLKEVANLFGQEPYGKLTAFVAALVAAAVVFVDSALAALPADWQPGVAAALSIVATLLSAFGLNRTIKAFSR